MLPRIVFAATLLAAVTSHAAKPITLAVPGLSTVSVAPELASFYSEHLGQAMARQGLRVTTAKQVQTLLGQERQRQLLGCAADSACIVEIANALATDTVLIGQVAKVGGAQQFNIQVLEARTGLVVASFSARVTGEELILETLDRAAVRLSRELAAKLGRPLVTAGGEEAVASLQTGGERLETGARRFAWIPATAGLALGAAGGFFLWRSNAAYAQLADTQRPPLSGAIADGLAARGRQDQTMGLIGAGLAAASVVTAGALFALGGSSSTVEAGAALVPGGAGLVVSGVLP